MLINFDVLVVYKRKYNIIWIVEYLEEIEGSKENMCMAEVGMVFGDGKTYEKYKERNYCLLVS